LLLFLGHLVKLRFDIVDLSLDLVAQLCLAFDVKTRILKIGTTFPDVFLMCWTLLSLKNLEFNESRLLIDCRATVRILLTTFRHTCDHALLLLLVDELVLAFGEVLVSLHLCDSLLSFLTNFDFGNRL
jgi:hypothetical protein